MADYIVYGPFSGTLWGQDCYCGNCSGGSPCNSGGYCTSCGSGDANCRHNTGINGLCCPTDVGGAANTAVKLSLSSNILSVRTYRTGPSDDGDALCATTPPSGFGWVNEGIKVQLYNAPNGLRTLVGIVFYGHLTSRIANGIYNNPNNLTIGYLGSQDCNCACYHGIHVHMERSSWYSGYTYHRSCYTSVIYATAIYRWTI